MQVERCAAKCRKSACCACNADGEPTAHLGKSCETEQGESGECVSKYLCKAKAEGFSAFSWGYNTFGQLGDGTTVDSNVPVAISSELVKAWTLVSAGGYHMCGIASDDRGYCWGFNAFGQIGDGAFTGSTVPVQISNDAVQKWGEISAGLFHTCGISVDGEGFCWGWNIFGQLGDNSFQDSNLPVGIDNCIVSQWKSLSSGYFHTCGVASDDKGYCWGYNDYGELGTGNFQISTTPIEINTKLNLYWRHISAAGYYHTCGVATDDQGYCWGWNAYGQLGDGTNNLSTVPIPISTKTVQTWKLIALGGFHTCGIASDDKGYCWGSNAFGQIGDGTYTSSTVPIAISNKIVSAWKSIDAGEYYTCGIALDDKGYCWGYNYYGQVGDGSNTDTTVPVQISTEAKWKELTAGVFSSAGLSA